VLGDPQVQSRRLVERVEFPGDARGVPVSRPAARLSRSPGEVRRGAPLLGQHTDEILAELGFTAEKIGAFRSQGLI
jgi:crotonobetainyl-CoA:carnitine CoA-transferase CaiB-like acyl-CoA transferase